MVTQHPNLCISAHALKFPFLDCFYLDMNGVIHQCSHSSDEALITARDESEIFLTVFAYVQALFDKIRPTKLLFLAVDGVAPRAKMNQQRSRRFRTAAEKAEAERKEEAKSKKAAPGAELQLQGKDLILAMRDGYPF